MIFSQLRVFALLFASILSVQIYAAAQQTLGAMGGSVTDQSAAVLPGTEVSIRNNSTGLAKDAKTQAQGTYLFSDLPIGTYTVTFSHDGFSKETHPAILVQGNRTTTLNVALRLGAVSSVVEVQGTPLINQVDTTNGYVLDNAQIETVPLGTGSFTELATLAPGTNADFLTGAGTNDGLGNQSIFSNGQRDTSNSFSFNGINVNNLFNGKSSSRVAANRFVLSTGESFGAGGDIQTNTSVYDAIGQALPSAPPETIQELRVNTSQYDASQGQNSGAHIEQVTKSGGNAFHGQLYGDRHTAWLDAAPFFRKRDPSIPLGQAVPQIHRFTAGGEFGGPIIRNKLFFFASYQAVRVSDEENGEVQTSVPQGLTDDRSIAGLIAAENAFANEANPGSAPLTPGQLDPAAVKLLQFKLPSGQFLIPSSQISDPALAANLGFDTLVRGPAGRFQQDQASLNLDYNFSKNDTISGKYYYQRDPTSNPFTSQANTLGFPEELLSGSHVFSLTNTATLSPTLVYDQRIGYVRETAFATTTQQVTPGAVGINLPGLTKFPGIILNLADNNTGGALNIGPTTPFANAGMFQNQYEISGNLNWLLGRHNIALGYNYDYTQLNILNQNTSVATLTFDTFSDFITGNVRPGLGNSEFFQGSANRYYRAPQSGVYFNDKVSLTKNLSVTVGLRWDYDGALSEKFGNLVNFDSSLYQYSDSTDTIVNDGLIVAGNNKRFHTPGASDSTLKGRQWGLAPRLGLIYSPRSNLVLRAGFGLYYDRGEFFSYFSPGAGNGFNGPFGVTLQPPFVLPTAAQAGATLSNPFGNSTAVPVTGDPAGFAALLPNAAQLETGNFPAGNQFGPFLFAGYDLHNKLPYSENWNLDVQWQPAHNWVATVAYIGNHGVHQVVPVPFNQPGIATPAHPIHGQTFSYGYQVSANELFNTPTGGNTDLRVPFIGYSPNSVLYEAAGISRYDALQTNLTHRFSHGLQFGASYTYSHALDEQSGLGLFYNGNNPLDLRSGYGNADFDRPNVTAFNYSYQLPTWVQGNGFAAKVVNGWGLSGVTKLQSGQPYNVYDFSGSVAGIFYGANDFITNPIIPFAPGASAQSALTGHSGAFDTPAINFQAFAVPVVTAGSPAANALGVPPCDSAGVCDNSETTFGPRGGRNVFRGAFQKRADITLFKNTKLTERFALKTEMQVFNLTNTPSFDTPNNNVRFDPDFNGVYVAVPRGQLGVIQHTIGSPRFVQFAMHLTF